MAEIRITSDGTKNGTRVVDNATGEAIEGIRTVEFRHECGGLPSVRVTTLEAVFEARYYPPASRLQGLGLIDGSGYGERPVTVVRRDKRG